MNLPDNTGERILLEKESPLMIARHLSAYRFAREHVCRKSVLEIGCGEGYGSSYLAEAAREVTAIDYEESVIRYAKEKYRKSNLAFRPLDVVQLRSLNAKFEVICCFQVIEHIPDTSRFLGDVLGLLQENGLFICSTPSRLDASPHSITPANRFHVREYLWDEFKNLLKPYFKDVTIFGLKRGRELEFYRRLKKSGLFNFLPDALNPVKRFYKRISCENFMTTEINVAGALDFIAVCKK